MVSPATGGLLKFGVAVVTKSMDIVRLAVTVMIAVLDVMAPEDAVAVLVIEPASMSAWVIACVEVQLIEPLGASGGRGVIVNTNASVDHDTMVGDFAHVSSGATVGARVRIGAETLISIGASVISDMTVGARTIIGSGAAVVAPIPDDVVAFGVPARIRSDRKP